jgi:hypothetical protein
LFRSLWRERLIWNQELENKRRMEKKIHNDNLHSSTKYYALKSINLLLILFAIERFA